MHIIQALSAVHMSWRVESRLLRDGTRILTTNEATIPSTILRTVEINDLPVEF